MRAIRTYFSVILLAVISFAITPKEFIHDLYDHTDTVEDQYCLHGILHVDGTHHHCEMLSYAAFPFEGNTGEISFNNLPVIVSRHVIQDYGFVQSLRYNLSRFRAPPIA